MNAYVRTESGGLITERMRECREAYDDAGQQAALECAARLTPLPDSAYCPACECETYADDGVCLVCWSECEVPELSRCDGCGDGFPYALRERKDWDGQGFYCAECYAQESAEDGRT